jgi:hypothetical protein
VGGFPGSFFNFESASSTRDRQSHNQKQEHAGENMMAIIFNVLSDGPATVKQLEDIRKYDFS